jgi:YVTN family beta-propeller protein
MRRNWFPHAGVRSPCAQDIVRGAARALSALTLVVLVGCHRGHGPRAFVTNEDEGTVSVIDARSFEVIETINVGQRPRGVRVSSDARWLYVALSGSPKAGPGVDEAKLPPPNRTADGIGVIDLGDLTLVRTLPSGPDPESFDLVGDHLLVVSNEETAEASIIDLDHARLRGRVDAGREPEGVATAPDHSVWVTSETENRIAVIDPQEPAVLGSIATGARPRGIAFTPDGARALITNENDASITVADVKARRAVAKIALPSDASAPSPPRPMGVAITQDGKRAFVTMGRAGGVAVVDVATSKLVTVIPAVGKRPWGVAIAPSGLVFTANGPSNDVSVIDPATAKVMQHIHTGGSPWGVAIAP